MSENKKGVPGDGAAEAGSVRQRILALRDPDYAVFLRRLLPTLPPERIVGVRTPALRALAKELAGTPQAQALLRDLPHFYFEENNLHAFLLARQKEFGAALAGVEAFLPLVDNWATCDQMNPRAFRGRLPELLPAVRAWLASGETYTVRFALGMLMAHGLDEAFAPDYLALAASAREDDYYVRMMVAWYFATALAKQWDAALPYLTECRLETWTHNKTIQKAVESFRITPQHKEALRALRRR